MNRVSITEIIKATSRIWRLTIQLIQKDYKPIVHDPHLPYDASKNKKNC